ncbi:glutathione S-transferase domain-containing protein [Geranomyces variabilis]|nr:glutathione S-transferase domain-containing protein [Geranomyces variabilis]KAJ3138280.1 Glutathione S-transferase protein [Geranomyces variabilis]
MMKLYCSPTSPYARKALILVHELGLAPERIALIPVRANPNLAIPSDAPMLAKHNPLAKLPVLILDDGETAIYDSTVICQYLDSLRGDDYSGHRYFPRESDPTRWTQLTLHALATGMCEAASACVYERSPTVRAAEFYSQAVVDAQWAKIARGLDELELRAKAKQLDGWGIGEIAVVCVLGYMDLRFAEKKWREGRPALAAWAAKMEEERASVRETKPPPA